MRKGALVQSFRWFVHGILKLIWKSGSNATMFAMQCWIAGMHAAKLVIKKGIILNVIER